MVKKVAVTKNVSITNEFSTGDMVSILIEAGELIGLGGDFYEDMGGAVITSNDDSTIKSYFTYFFENLSEDEQKQILIKGEL